MLTLITVAEFVIVQLKSLHIWTDRQTDMLDSVLIEYKETKVSLVCSVRDFHLTS